MKLFYLIRLILSINTLSGELTSFLPFLNAAGMLSNNKEEFYPEMGKTQLKISLYIWLGLCKDLFLVLEGFLAINIGSPPSIPMTLVF